MRSIRPDKFKDGDITFEILHKLGISNINNKSPTMWKKLQNNTVKEYHVDTLWITNNIDNEINITHHFLNNVTTSDHYPNHIHLQHIGWQQIPKIKGFKWNLNTATESKWNEFRSQISTNISQLHQITQSQYSENNDKTTIINTAIQILCQTLHQAVKYYYQ